MYVAFYAMLCSVINNSFEKLLSAQGTLTIEKLLSDLQNCENIGDFS
jgi:hypothetical protein